jgi:hypothetical protein
MRLFKSNQLRDHMLVLGGFILWRQHQVAFDLADNGQAVNIAFYFWYLG